MTDFLSFDLDENAVAGSGNEYMGKLPPAKLALVGVISRAYLGRTNDTNEPLLKVLYTVTEGEFAGFTQWDNILLANRASFKWVPFVEAIGVTNADIAKKMRVNTAEKTEAGTRVLSIGARDLTTDEGIPVTFAIRYETFKGVTSPKFATVLPRTDAASK